MNRQPLLSICIPIYNRLEYLNRMLSRFLEDKDLFEEDIHLYISDNCSNDDLQSCCERFQKQGLSLIYHRNAVNIGADKNFEWCFQNAKGTYTWLLGSDDIPVKGLLRTIVAKLKEDEYGLFHLYRTGKQEVLKKLILPDEMAILVSYWITFISANIFNSNVVHEIRFESYRKTNLLQISVYLAACYSSRRNAILYLNDTFEDDGNWLNNSGYNFYQVFVKNYLSIWREFCIQRNISNTVFEAIKKDLFVKYIHPNNIRLLAQRNGIKKGMESRNGLYVDHAWRYLFKFYGNNWYFYKSLLPLSYRYLRNWGGRIIKSQRTI